MKKYLKLKFILSILFIITIMVCCSVNTKLGKAPNGESVKKMKTYPNYIDGSFVNIESTPAFGEGYGFWSVSYSFMFDEVLRPAPKDTIVSIKTDLKSLDPNTNLLVWFGHSSYFIQLDGVKFLVDPVFSGSASPVSSFIKAFEGTNVYQVKDMPEIDYLLITHDHYDHLDYETVVALKSKVKNIICGIGVGSHFEYWNFPKEMIKEQYWGDKFEIAKDYSLGTETSRHFSGRFLSRNNTLWVSYMIESPSMKIYLGGDSGYGKHFKDLGSKYESVDLAILENGQYNEKWPYIHSMPEEVLKAGSDLNAKRIMPVHSGKFTLAQHSWDEPLSKLVEFNQHYKKELVTPKIGEVVYLNNLNQKFINWWESYE
jgi:L-ascorbate metabolism protein UlaG (beta-lactamase superfamily)